MSTSAARRAANVAFIVMLAGCNASSATLASGAPTCEQVRSFAQQLVSVGITYDYEPSDGPADLAARVDVVLRGELTGEVTSAPATSPAHDAYIGYEIAVQDVLVGDGRGDTVIVSVPYNAHLLDAAAFANAVVAGVPVIVFAHGRPDAPGGLVAAVMEGFLTACAGQEPLGFVGVSGGWPEIRSLEAVATAVAETGQ